MVNLLVFVVTLRHSHSDHIRRKGKSFPLLPPPAPFAQILIQKWREKGRLGNPAEMYVKNRLKSKGCEICFSLWRAPSTYDSLSANLFPNGKLYFHRNLYILFITSSSNVRTRKRRKSWNFIWRWYQSRNIKWEISKIIKELPGIENAKKKFFPLQIFFISFWFST